MAGLKAVAHTTGGGGPSAINDPINDQPGGITGNPSVDYVNRLLYYSALSGGGVSINWDLARLIDPFGKDSLNWYTRLFFNNNGDEAFDYTGDIGRLELPGHAGLTPQLVFFPDPTANPVTPYHDGGMWYNGTNLWFRNGAVNVDLLAPILDKTGSIGVNAATTGALPNTPVYNNGTAGVGATLTAGSNGALPAQDGVTLFNGDELLVKDQAATLRNGVYSVTSVGDGSNPYILTRTTNSDETAEFDPQIVIPAGGAVNAGLVYGQQTNNPIVGTDPIVYTTTTANNVSQATTGTQVSGQIPFWNSVARQLTKGTSNFVYDIVNNRIGLFTATPSFPFDLSAGTNRYALSGTNFILSNISNTITIPGSTGAYIQMSSAATIDLASNPVGAQNFQGTNFSTSVPATNSTVATNASLTGGFQSTAYAGTGGIGTVTGLSGTASISGSGTVGNVNGGTFTATISGTSTGTPNHIGVSAIAQVSGAASVTSVLGASFVGQVTNASAVVTSIIGMQVTGSYSTTGTLSNILSTNSVAQVTAAGTISSVEGTRCRWINSGAATITNARNFNMLSWGNTVGAGVVTNAYGLQIGAISNTGTMTNTYGIRVDSMTAGTQTNNPYGIYQSGTTDYNYFAGKTGFGASAANLPAAAVHIISTTEQFRAGYDTSNYFNAVVGSTGGVTVDAVGVGARFDWGDDFGELTINPLQTVVDKPHLKLRSRTNSLTPQVGGIESTGNDLSYTIAGGTRKSVTFKEDLVNDKTVTERIRISGDEMIFGNVIQTGVKAFVQIPYNAAITAVTALADQTGSIVVDIFKQPYATFSPLLLTYTNNYINQAVQPFNSRWLRGKLGKGNFTQARPNTIQPVNNIVPFVNWFLNPLMTYLTPITISSNSKYQDNTLTGWDSNVKAGDILCFVVNSATTITRLDLSLTMQKF